MTNTITSTDFDFQGQQSVYHGKVRDVYITDQWFVSVATDRISAFDVILPRGIPHKGQVLNQIAQHFLEATSDIVPNWFVEAPDPNVSIGHICEPFKIEMVIRGCLVGHSWREYSSGKRELCGQAMPNGLQEYDVFPEPIITPATKADEGHDEDISLADIVTRGLASQQQLDQLCDYTRQLFARGQQMANDRGLLLADTKYEFGLKDGQIYLIDEVHTPDSSRYFVLDSHRAYLADRTQPTPKHLSKEFVREWLLANDFNGQDGQAVPDMSDEWVTEISERYIELYEAVTGKSFEPADTSNTNDRITQNVTQALQELNI